MQIKNSKVRTHFIHKYDILGLNILITLGCDDINFLPQYHDLGVIVPNKRFTLFNANLHIKNRDQ